MFLVLVSFVSLMHLQSLECGKFFDVFHRKRISPCVNIYNKKLLGVEHRIIEN